MNDTKIKNKILNNQRLTREEVQYIVEHWNAEKCFENHDGPQYWILYTLIYKINDKYYSIYYQNGLTEDCDNHYPDQVAAQVEKVPITTYKWEKVKNEI